MRGRGPLFGVGTCYNLKKKNGRNERISDGWLIGQCVMYHCLFTALATSEPALYHALTSGLTEAQQKQLNAVFVLADQRKAQQDSKRIEQSGGM